MSSLKYTALATIALAAASATPAAAVVTTFATFSALTTAHNFRLVNSGNSTAKTRTTDATLYTVSTAKGTAPGATLVRFSFLETPLAAFVTDATAAFTYNATIARGTSAFVNGSNIEQDGITGSFSFITTKAITVTGPKFVPHTYAAGSNLLSGTFTDAVLFGGGSSAATDASTQNGNNVTFTSDFLDFSKTVNRDRGLTLTSIAPLLGIHAGSNKALNSFYATAGGQFSSDPAPIVNGLAVVPEPGVWVLMIAGFGLVGMSARRRQIVAA